MAGRVHNSLHGNGSNSEANSQDREKEQLELLARYRGDLRAKKDVQQSFILEGDPATMLEEVMLLILFNRVTRSFHTSSIYVSNNNNAVWNYLNFSINPSSLSCNSDLLLFIYAVDSRQYDHQEIVLQIVLMCLPFPNSYLQVLLSINKAVITILGH